MGQDISAKEWCKKGLGVGLRLGLVLGVRLGLGLRLGLQLHNFPAGVEQNVESNSDVLLQDFYVYGKDPTGHTKPRGVVIALW